MHWLWNVGALLAGVALSHFALQHRLKRSPPPAAGIASKFGWPLLIPAGLYTGLLLWSLPGFIRWMGEYHSHWALDLAVISDDYFVPISVGGIAWLGWRDDRGGLAGRKKLIVILLAWALVTIPLVLGQRAAPDLFRTGGSEHDEAIAVKALYDAMSLTWATLAGIALTIALPLVDGLNGLFLGMLGVAFIHFWHCLAYQRGITPFNSSPGGLLLVLTLGILLGLLLHNFPHGRIRLPETAVLPLAFMTGLAARTALRGTPPGVAWPFFSSEHAGYDELRASFVRSAVIVTSPLLYPVIDLAVVTINRIRRSRSAFTGGHDHLHHRLQQSGFSPMRTTLALTGAAAAPALCVGTFLLSQAEGWRKRWRWIDWNSTRQHPLPGIDVYDARVLVACMIGLIPLAYLFWRGYAKVDPYKSGAVDERGRP